TDLSGVDIYFKYVNMSFKTEFACLLQLQTTTFLYGCAVNAFLLKAGWAYDSIKAGSVLPPDKYEILSNRAERVLNHIGKSITQNEVDYIFVKVGIMLHGTHSFCTRFAKCIKHGRGLVYKSLQWLVQSLEKKKISLGAIVVEEENRATRHLKKYASEQKIPVMVRCTCHHLVCLVDLSGFSNISLSEKSV
ncbi:hypothetical protein KSS87_001839, partial [Heliosperma pusillum]